MFAKYLSTQKCKDTNVTNYLHIVTFLSQLSVIILLNLCIINQSINQSLSFSINIKHTTLQKDLFLTQFYNFLFLIVIIRE